MSEERRLHIHLRPLVVAAPADALSLILGAADAAADDIVVAGIDDGSRVAEQLQLLHALLVHRAKVLLVGGADGCEYAYGGLDNVVKCQHLARLADACLKDAHLRPLVEQPY